MQKNFEIVHCGFEKLCILYIVETKNKQETK